ncbi:MULTISPECIES: response regulator [Prolixibacter]|uniref:response regulator n=1 Tax=Prolixibacter TaxID=314318 RepID=UPI001E65CD03|nr:MULTISPECIES: response regulator [Prolixibacter]
MKIEDQNKEGLSILLVEDNFLNQKITTYNLRKYNHKVSIANNGLEAVNLFKEKKFDLILMDIMMPVMDGLEATREIRKIEKANKLSEYTPIIAVTANTLDNDREKCLSWGMDEFIAKPFDMNQLNEILLSLKIV